MQDEIAKAVLEFAGRVENKEVVVCDDFAALLSKIFRRVYVIASREMAKKLKTELGGLGIRNVGIVVGNNPVFDFRVNLVLLSGLCKMDMEWAKDADYMIVVEKKTEKSTGISGLPVTEDFEILEVYTTKNCSIIFAKKLG
ncbi:hypothetical protein Asulf_00494 [Archaeoglobus sulfaticallidus PM70-1]|uniref:Uncharacterized protein n=1 Tax=Archaeoglobus sulfaticallidus PM70-1 TaxID=387631 RepID=N0BE80_9EURY|nr:hypothetical protein [Archaeoglobus sulfaticallidus]AGK60517.1 hypothetical protein Asulf_00494 [Archaeoglobus sulfaticallidus PM70-1]